MSMVSRRNFMKCLAGGVSGLAFADWLGGSEIKNGETQERPNILWISCEDISPNLGCYGDKYAISPNLDKLAEEGVRYSNAFTPAALCAPVRSATITGMYQGAIGTGYQRCQGIPPAEVKCFSEYLRTYGYYCTNCHKTDYQFYPPFTAWDEWGRKAYWWNRPAGKPFFSVINFEITHESQIRMPVGRKAEIHDPAKAVVPPYYPDTPLVRNDLACYADNITIMDKEAGELLKRLKEDGLDEDTIVWFWGDHGSGMPRCKRWLYDSGLHVPLLIRVPKKWRKWADPGNPKALEAGTVDDELVSFVDFAPTMLSLAGIPIPKYMQGQAFLGPQKAKQPRKYVYGARDRVDEKPDMSRSVRDKRYNYIRNFMIQVPYSAVTNYGELMPTMREMRRLNAEGKLTGAAKEWFGDNRPVEELYDVQNDPYEVNNLAGDPKYKDTLLRMRKELERWMIETKDMGLIPEPDFDELKRPGDKYEITAKPLIIPMKGMTRENGGLVQILCQTQGASIGYRIADKKQKSKEQLYTKPVFLKPGQDLVAKACRIGFKNSKEVRYRIGDPTAMPSEAAKKYVYWREKIKPGLLKRLLEVKDLDLKGKEGLGKYLKLLEDEDAAVRYWAVIGVHYLSKDKSEIDKAKPILEKLIKDESVSVRIAAAEALCDWGEEKKGLPVLVDILQNGNGSGRHYAMVAVEEIGDKAKPALEVIRARVDDGNAGQVALRILGIKYKDKPVYFWREQRVGKF